MKSLILKIVFLALLFSACNNSTSSEKKTETTSPKPVETISETPQPNSDSDNNNIVAKPLTQTKPNGNQEYYGMYTYMADANMFTSCDKSVKMSIAMKEKYLDLERRYLTVAEGGDKVFIHFKGKIEKIPAMEGEGTEDALVILELIEVDKAKRCE